MNLSQWAIKWGVSLEAVEDLKRTLGTGDLPPTSTAGGSEGALQDRIRLEATQKGLRLWRNNIGACFREDGRFLRYGLANDSTAVNARIKSSDLIGIRPLNIGGVVIGQFVAREIKKPGWQYSGSDREQAQLKFLKLVSSFGGDACFANNEGTL